MSFPLLPTYKNTVELTVETIKSKNKSAWLATTQPGVNVRIIIYSFAYDVNNLDGMVNPTYINNGTLKE